MNTDRKRNLFLISLVFMIMVLAASCQFEDNSPFMESGFENLTVKNYVKEGCPDVLKVTRCLFFGDSNENTDLKEEFMRVFYEKTGIPLKVIYPARYNYMSNVSLMIASGELDGIVNMFTSYNIMAAVDEGTIVPLNEYLEDNENWNSMPDGYREMFSLNGKVYAISAGYEGNSFTRSFRKDWLDNLGLKVPETLEELFEAARAFTEDDPDGNGKDDTTGLTSSRFWNLQDIFQAFDAPLNNTGDMPISWDPVSEVWQDSMLKPEMAEALQYIKKLYELGYLDQKFLTNEGANMREKLWTGKAGSAFYWAMHAYRQAATEMKFTTPEAKWVEVPAIKGRRTEKLNYRVMTGLCYALVRGTKQPKETVNTFLNMLFDKETHFMLRYGIEGKTYRWEGDTLIILTDPVTGKPYDQPGLTQEMPQFDRFRYPWCYDGSEQEIRETLALFEIEREMIESAEKSNSIYIVDKFTFDTPASKEYTLQSSDMYKVFEEETSKAILGEKSISQALFDYRIRMKALGGDKVLEEANAAIGKKPNQKY